MITLRKDRFGIEWGNHFFGYTSWTEEEDEPIVPFVPPKEGTHEWYLYQSIRPSIEAMKDDLAKKMTNLDGKALMDNSRGMTIPFTNKTQ